MVEHLLAKEDVASSSLVTRSSFRLERCTKAEAGARGPELIVKADRPIGSSYGWQAGLVML